MAFPFNAQCSPVFYTQPSTSTAITPSPTSGYPFPSQFVQFPVPIYNLQPSPLTPPMVPPSRAGTSFQLNLPPAPMPGTLWYNHSNGRNDMKLNYEIKQGEPSPNEIFGIKKNMDRTIVVMRRLCNVTANWTYAYHNSEFRRWLHEQLYVTFDQIFQAKMIPCQGHIFGVFVLCDPKTAMNVMEHYKKYSEVHKNSFLKMYSPHVLLPEFSGSVKKALTGVNERVDNMDTIITDALELKALQGKTAAPMTYQQKNVF